MDTQPNNGLVINGIYHTLVKSECSNPCYACSLREKCIDEKSSAYFCELFPHGKTEVHFVKYGELIQIHTLRQTLLN